MKFPEAAHAITTDRLYSKLAPIYSFYSFVGSAGLFPRIYPWLADQMELRAGDTVLDLGCGTGQFFEYLTARLGPSGRIIGVDNSPEMLDQASRRAKDAGWNNIALIRADLAEFRSDVPCQCVCAIKCLSHLPRPDEVLARAVDRLDPGRRVVIVDAFIVPGDRRQLLGNFVNRFKSHLFHFNPRNRLPDFFDNCLDEVVSLPKRMGMYTVLVGRKPRSNC